MAGPEGRRSMSCGVRTLPHLRPMRQAYLQVRGQILRFPRTGDDKLAHEQAPRSSSRQA
jgi:hypothetical protein